MSESSPPLTISEAEMFAAAQPEKTPWNGWWTLLFGGVLFVVWQIALTLGIVFIIELDDSVGSELSSKGFSEAAKILATDGDVIGILSFLAVFVICPLCWFIGKLRPGWGGWEYLGSSPVRWFHWPLWSFIIIFCSILLGLLSPSIGLEGMDPSMAKMAETTQIPFLLFLGVAIGAPAVEEFIFRGLLFRGWRTSRLGVTGTIILTSFLWTILHVQYPSLILIYLFILGIVIGIAREVTGNLWIPIWMHFVNNSLAVFAMLVSDAKSLESTACMISY